MDQRISLIVRRNAEKRFASRYATARWFHSRANDEGGGGAGHVPRRVMKDR